MSTSAGAGGVFGISLWDLELVADIYKELKNFIADAVEHDPDYDVFLDKPESIRGFKKFEKRIIQRLEANNIFVPKSARLLGTGSEDDRPGNCDAPGDEFVIGFGLFTVPWKYPPMDKSFKRLAKWHTWAWAG